MTTPVRIQLSRRKGFNLQEHSRAVNGLEAVVVTRPGRWGNPWTIGDVGSAKNAVRRFEAATMGFYANGDFCKPQAHPDSYIGRIITDAKPMLRGKNLACWCRLGAHCHADVLLELANRS